jgi:hypothetical protein
MATVVSILDPVSEEAAHRKEEAEDHWKKVLGSAGFVGHHTLRIGFHAAAIKQENAFGLLGYESEDDARKAAEVGESTWYANIRIAENFPGIEEKLFCSMKLSNAKRLCDLPESKRLTEYWIRLAGTESIAKFAELVNVEMNGAAKESDGKEKSVTFKQTMPASRKKMVEEGLKQYALEIGVDDSRALEFMVEERKQAPSLLGVITEAVKRIGRIRDIRQSGLSVEEVLDGEMVELSAMLRDFEQAVLGVQNSESE